MTHWLYLEHPQVYLLTLACGEPAAATRALKAREVVPRDSNRDDEKAYHYALSFRRTLGGALLYKMTDPEIQENCDFAQNTPRSPPKHTICIQKSHNCVE